MNPNLADAWTTGDEHSGPGAQDQMRIVKQRLIEMLPGIRVFLGMRRVDQTTRQG